MRLYSSEYPDQSSYPTHGGGSHMLIGVLGVVSSRHTPHMDKRRPGGGRSVQTSS